MNTNLFDTSLVKDKLYNLSSGLPLDGENTEAILNISNAGVMLSKEFREKRMVTKKLEFHAPISRNKCESFSKALKSVSVKNDNKVKTLEANRNINNLLSFTIKSGNVFDFEDALKYPFSKSS